MQYQEIVSVQSQLVSFIQKQQITGLLFENMYFYCAYSIKTEILSMLPVLGTFWKSQKLIPSEKNQSFLITKISSRTTQKITNLRK